MRQRFFLHDGYESFEKPMGTKDLVTISVATAAMGAINAGAVFLLAWEIPRRLVFGTTGVAKSCSVWAVRLLPVISCGRSRYLDTLSREHVCVVAAFFLRTVLASLVVISKGCVSMMSICADLWTWTLLSERSFWILDAALRENPRPAPKCFRRPSFHRPECRQASMVRPLLSPELLPFLAETSPASRARFFYLTKSWEYAPSRLARFVERARTNFWPFPKHPFFTWGMVAILVAEPVTAPNRFHDWRQCGPRKDIGSPPPRPRDAPLRSNQG